MIKRVVSVSAAYTPLIRDDIIQVDTSAAVTITLPTAALGKKKRFEVKDGTGSGATNNITVTGAGSETFDGAGNYTISTNYGSNNFTPNALRTAWLVS